MGWQRRTLPHGDPCSTIRAGELNDRVRDGAGWTLTALATNTHNPASPLDDEARPDNTPPATCTRAAQAAQSTNLPASEGKALDR